MKKCIQVSPGSQLKPPAMYKKTNSVDSNSVPVY